MLSSLFYRGSIEVMDDCSWMFRDSPQGLQRMDYCNGVQSFINFATSIREILVEAILGVHAGSVKIKSLCIQML
jgi:hypothetical protein